MDDDEPAVAAEEDELAAEAQAVLEELVDDGLLEVASRRSVQSLACLELVGIVTHPDGNISDWLVERREVTELYAEEEELRRRFRRVTARGTNDATPTRHHPELAHQILENPDEAEVWSVYADWLQEQGDPRGELVSLQLQRAGTKRKKLDAREEALLALHRRHFYRDLVVGKDPDDAKVTFRNGFFDEAFVTHPVDLGALLEAESSRFLRKLVVRCDDGAPFLDVLVHRPLPASLVTLELGEPLGWRPRCGLVDAGLLTRGLVRLQRLVLRQIEIHLGGLGTAALRELVIEAQHLHVEPRAISTLERLERIELGGTELPLPLTSATLFDGAPPGVRELVLADGHADAETALELLGRLVRSPLARSLRSLVLPARWLEEREACAIFLDRGRWPRLDTFRPAGPGLNRSARRELARVWWPDALANFANADRRADDDIDDDDDDRPSRTITR